MALQQEIIITGNADQLGTAMKNVSDNISDAFGKATDKLKDTVKSVDSLDSVYGKLDSKIQMVQSNAVKTFENMEKSSRGFMSSTESRIKQMDNEIRKIEEKNVEEYKGDMFREQIAFKEKMRIADKLKLADDEKKSIAQNHKQGLDAINESFQLEKMRSEELRKIFDDTYGGKGGAGGSGMPRMGGAVGGAKSGFSAAAGAAGFGGLLSIGGFIGKLVSEGEQLGKASSSLSGISDGGVSVGGRAFDMKSADFMKYAKEVATQSGSVGDLQTRARQQYGFEKGFGMQSGTLGALSGTLRASDKGESAAEASVEMLNIFKKSKVFDVEKGDFSQLGEKVQFMTQMNQQQMQQMESINSTTSSTLVSAFGQMGIGDSRMMDMTNNINQGITDPKDAFQGAVVLRALQRKNPNMSLMGLQKQQEKGIYGEGNFEAVMESMREMYSGEMLTRAISSTFGLKLWQAEKLASTDVDLGQISSKEELQSALGKDYTEMGDVMKRGENNTTMIERTLAKLNSWFGEKGEDGLNKVGEYVSAYDKGGMSGVMEKIGSDLSSAIEDGFDKVYNKIFGISEEGATSSSKKTSEEVFKELNSRTKGRLNTSNLPDYLQGLDMDKSGALETRGEATGAVGLLRAKAGQMGVSEDDPLITSLNELTVTIMELREGETLGKLSMNKLGDAVKQMNVLENKTNVVTTNYED